MLNANQYTTMNSSSIKSKYKLIAIISHEAMLKADTVFYYYIGDLGKVIFRW